MHGISDWWGRIGLQLKLQILIQGFLVVILVSAQQWISIQFEQQLLTAAEERAAEVADGAINGLNTLMVTKMGDNEVISDKASRALFIEKMGKSDKLLELRIVRAKQLDEEFPPGLPQEQPVDDIDRSVLSSGKMQFKMVRHDNGEASLRAVLPFIAMKEFRTSKCLKCHGVDEGTVLGAASVTIDVKDDLATIRQINTWIWIGQGVLQIILFFVIGFIVHRLLRQLGGEPKTAVDVALAVADGKLDNVIDLRAGDTTSLLASMKRMQSSLLQRDEHDHRKAAEMTRIKMALDNVSTGVMIADGERNIIYTNKSAQDLFQSTQGDIRKHLPNFNAENMVGSNIDSVHKNPAHQAALLSTLTKPHSADVEIGGRHMTVIANPVMNDKGQRLGSVAEWHDRTSEVMVQREVAEIVAAASNGDLSGRIDMTGKEGFLAVLGEGINHLLHNTQQALNTTSEVLNRVANGDLTHQVEENYQGIFGQLKDDTNGTVERLREVIGSIKEAAEAINTAAREIASGNQDLSSRTEEQASSLEETTSSMEDLNATVQKNAGNARQANDLAKASNEMASKGGEMVKRVIGTMGDIQSSSRKIADIIGVIDSIAFQTNILALNAAVEAARAGEQGRGFAVVATEVRNLAQRSATAAKEIKTLISESVDKVEGGAKLAQEAGSAMDEVVKSFQQVAGLVTEISNASLDQSTGIGEVTRAVGQMDETTQQNAALVEEAAAAAESLEEQARGLVQSVAMFKLSEGDSGGMPSAARAAPRQLGRPAAARIASRVTKAIPSAHADDPGEEWDEF